MTTHLVLPSGGGRLMLSTDPDGNVHADGYMAKVHPAGVALLIANLTGGDPAEELIEEAFGGGTGWILHGWRGACVLTFPAGTDPKRVADALVDAAKRKPGLPKPGPRDICAVYEDGEPAIVDVMHGYAIRREFPDDARAQDREGG